MRTPKSILERRRSVRVDDSLPFKIGHADYEAEARTVNISLNGALCIVDKNIPVMTQLRVALSLPGAKGKRAKTIKIKGVVVRREPDPQTNDWLLAVYFSEIKPEDQDTLRRYIESRLSDRG
jgi:c-di-GMP-binding flagellar brake protein YcgR